MNVFFGDNQFLGVNHSGGKSENYAHHFADRNNIIATLQFAWDAGIRDFAFTCNPHMHAILTDIKDDMPFHLHPALPYAQGINSALTNLGFFGFAKSEIQKVSFKDAMIVTKGLAGLDASTLWYPVINSQISGLPKDQIRSISLLNVATDFLLGCNRMGFVRGFCKCVSRRFQTKSSLYTMNLPQVADHIWGKGMDDVRIVSNFNELGFRVNPSKQNVVNTFDSYRDRDIFVMSVFSGMSETNPAEYIAKYDAIKGVIFGSSSESRIVNNYNTFKAILPA